MRDSASKVVGEIRAPLKGIVYEGPITVSDLGMVIQDIGNGVGILHKSDSMDQVRLGEILRVQYPTAKSKPVVERIDSTPAPAVSPALQSVLAEQKLAGPDQMGLFEPAVSKPKLSPRLG